MEIGKLLLVRIDDEVPGLAHNSALPRPIVARKAAN